MTPDSLEHIIQVLKLKGIDHWWSGPVDDFVSPALTVDGDQTKWTKGVDTMDVWFDSGTSWAILEDSQQSTSDDSDANTRTLADVCLEGSDQHRGWFQSLLLTAVGFSNKTDMEQGHDSSQGMPSIRPYGAVITHGFVLDQEAKKMSKSLGNVISPMAIINGGKVRETCTRWPWYFLYSHLLSRIRAGNQHMEQTSCDSGQRLSTTAVIHRLIPW